MARGSKYATSKEALGSEIIFQDGSRKPLRLFPCIPAEDCQSMSRQSASQGLPSSITPLHETPLGANHALNFRIHIIQPKFPWAENSLPQQKVLIAMMSCTISLNAWSLCTMLKRLFGVKPFLSERLFWSSHLSVFPLVYSPSGWQSLSR